MNNKQLTQTQINFNQHPITVDIYSNPNNQNSIILLAALGISMQKYARLIDALFDKKLNVIVADYPHCGRNTPLVSAKIDYGYADLVNQFIPALEQICVKLTGQQPILIGHSLGGHLAMLYAQTHCIKVIAIATGNIGLKYWDNRGKFNILKAVSIINLMILKDGYFAGYKIGFGNRETKSLMRDWCKVVFSGHYQHVLAHQHILKNDALFINFKGDNFAPLSSTLGLSQYFLNPQLASLDLSQQLKGNQHSVWTKQPNEVVNLINKWVNSVA